MYRHPKEKLYFLLAASIGGIIWLAIILGTVGIALVYVLFVGLGLFIAEKFLEASLYGNSIEVSETQLPEINQRVKDMGERMGLTNLPKVFVLNGNGLTNALAVKLFSGKYILLFSDLIDKTIYGDDRTALDFVIAHELAHHKMGHLSLWKNLLIKPSMFIPFLGSAYSRACEFTADGVAREMTSTDSGKRSLSYITAGSLKVSEGVCPESFLKQEQSINGLFGFLSEILSTHPRTTRRIAHLNQFEKVGFIQQTSNSY